MIAFSLMAASIPAAMAQKWEFGGGVGAGFYTSQDVTVAGLKGAAKFDNGIAVSAWLDNNTKGLFGGELRYDYQGGDQHLSSGGASVGFGAQTHAVHYDFLLHATPNGSVIRPFVAFGGGIKVYRGTGTEVAFQPLGNIALLSKTQDLEGMLSVGAGVKIKIAPGLNLRVEIHDYLTPFPSKVIVPASGGKVGGWLQDFVPMAGLSFAF